MRPYQGNEQPPLIIGYYPVRAKAQIPRLLCEVLGVPYRDLLLTPDQWKVYQATEAKDWPVRDMPFLKDGDFVVTGTPALIQYIMDKANRPDLRGVNIEDRIKMMSIRSRHDLRQLIIGLMVASRAKNTEQEQVIVQNAWDAKIKPILEVFEKDCKDQGWYFGYMTLMDFLVYELVNQITNILPAQMAAYPKLVALQQRMAVLPPIYNYQHSQRAVKEYSPVRFFTKFMQRMRESTSSSTSNSDNCGQMDIE